MNIIKFLVVFILTEARSLTRTRRDLSSSNRMANNIYLQERAMQNRKHNRLTRERRSYYQQLYNHFSKNSKNNIAILNYLESELKKL